MELKERLELLHWGPFQINMISRDSLHGVPILVQETPSIPSRLPNTRERRRTPRNPRDGNGLTCILSTMDDHTCFELGGGKLLLLCLFGHVSSIVLLPYPYWALTVCVSSIYSAVCAGAKPHGHASYSRPPVPPLTATTLGPGYAIWRFLGVFASPMTFTGNKHPYGEFTCT